MIYSFLIHDSLLFSINSFILSGVYQSTIPPILALLNWSNMYSTYQTLKFLSPRLSWDVFWWWRSSYKNKILGWVLSGCIAALQQSFCHQSNRWYQRSRTLRFFTNSKTGLQYFSREANNVSTPSKGLWGLQYLDIPKDFTIIMIITHHVATLDKIYSLLTLNIYKKKGRGRIHSNTTIMTQTCYIRSCML